MCICTYEISNQFYYTVVQLNIAQILITDTLAAKFNFSFIIFSVYIIVLNATRQISEWTQSIFHVFICRATILDILGYFDP